ncbi:MAG TPA: hypothetical protein VH351_03690 [Bryobacteraceae bacterium]|jgi:hypothetical protein|nr:hypothetical protein [Bryobacteraceae bacterium]
MKSALILVIAALSAFAGERRLVFTKSFPGSVPAYVYISVDGVGNLQYKEAPVDEQPVTARLSEADIAVLFDMAEKLNYFRDPLESGLKVANTGKKTFRYEDEKGKATEAVFNYSTALMAQQLLERFERIAESERAYINLDRTAHFDKLGVNDALAEIESLWLRKELVAPEQFVPLLNRVALHETYMHLARDRAARLKDAFEAAPVGASVSPASHP